MIIVIDFDGTIVEYDYPRIGMLKPNAKYVINKWYEAGHDIIINTCRCGEYEGDAVKFLKEVGIKFHYCNCNLPKMVEHYGADSRKISGDVYIDDKNLLVELDWLQIDKLLTEKLKSMTET